MRFIKRYLHDFHIAYESVKSNKLRSFLTALGIIFGVAAVICMMAIVNGTKQEILEQIKMVGVNNIVILPKVQEDKKDVNSASMQNDELGKQKVKYSPGLSLNDVMAIKSILPTIKLISPEIIVSNNIIQFGMKQESKLYGVM